MNNRVVIHFHNVYMEEFAQIADGRQLFVFRPPYHCPAISGDVVTVRELDNATGERTKREIVADVTSIMSLDHAQVVGILPRTLSVAPAPQGA